MGFPNTVEADMVLKVRPDTGEVLDHRNSKSSELGLIANTGLHQNLRGVTRAAGENDLATCINAVDCAKMRDLDSSSPVPVEYDGRAPRSSH
jgi:hypothetical protein